MESRSVVAWDGGGGVALARRAHWGIFGVEIESIRR